MQSKPAPLRYEIRSEQHLEELASAPLPGGVFATAARASQHRDLYLDTAEDALRRRDIICRLRLRADDTRTLSIRIADGPDGKEVTYDSPITSAEVSGALAERTAAGRRLSALIDPALLVVRLDLEVDRITRSADLDWLRRPKVDLHYDSFRVHEGDSSITFHQLSIEPRSGGEQSAQRIARAMERQHHLRPAMAGAREYAELLLRWKPVEEQAPTDEGRRSGQHTVKTATERRKPAEFLNPELSLLAFQSRVLALAEDSATPLKERLKFLAIVSANLDEFFMVRMGGLRKAASEQSEEQAADGFTRGEQVRLIAARVAELTQRQSRCAAECLLALENVGVKILKWPDLNDLQRKTLRAECLDQIHPSLTPMAVTLSPGHPLPHLPHLTLALAVVQRDSDTGRLHLAELDLPDDQPRFMDVPGANGSVIPIEEVVRANMDLVYPDGRIEGAYVFRVTRGGDLDLDEEGADDLIQAVSDAAERRPYNPAVRLEVERAMPVFVRDLVLSSLGREAPDDPAPLGPGDVTEIEGLLDLRALSKLPLPKDASLSYEPFQAREPMSESDSILSLMREGDLFYHHPFDSFASTVVKFLREASDDPDVTTIKITLYRVGNSSAIVDALVDAVKKDKRVVAFIELKARFDEEHNVAWARKLESAGGHVISGLVGLKNHAKVALVVRREHGKLRSYVHVGTGNYNTRSGLEYTDLSLFSSRDDITDDAADLFNSLTGGSVPPQELSRGALVAPHQLKDVLLSLIEREASNARAGEPAGISAKLNGLSDAEVVRAFLRAAADGVQIDLVVRGICTLRPRDFGKSSITVVSVVGRFLEHSRIYRFENSGAPEHYIGSADLRPRNLRRRIELLVPVVELAHKEELDRILDKYLDDPTGWELGADGEYTKRDGEGIGAQEYFMDAAKELRTAN
ncbi:MAG TPA: polyphosphate kinase 1 [Gemmatimonadaceae bacterium]